MLHPKQFKIDEAWIAFRLNNLPIRTQRDGDYHCIAVMDAASCYILGSEQFPTSRAELNRDAARGLLAVAREHHQTFPKTLYLPQEEASDQLTQAAAEQNINVVKVPVNDLEAIIGEARRGFAERFEGAPRRNA